MFASLAAIVVSLAAILVSLTTSVVSLAGFVVSLAGFVVSLAGLVVSLVAIAPPGTRRPTLRPTPFGRRSLHGHCSRLAAPDLPSATRAPVSPPLCPGVHPRAPDLRVFRRVLPRAGANVQGRLRLPTSAREASASRVPRSTPSNKEKPRGPWRRARATKARVARCAPRTATAAPMPAIAELVRVNAPHRATALAPSAIPWQATRAAKASASKSTESRSARSAAGSDPRRTAATRARNGLCRFPEESAGLIGDAGFCAVLCDTDDDCVHPGLGCAPFTDDATEAIVGRAGVCAP